VDGRSFFRTRGREIVPAALGLAGLGVLIVLGARPAAGEQVLENPGFETWDGPAAPASWDIQGAATVFQETASARTGTALGVTRPSPQTVRVASYAAVAGPGSTLSASAYVSGAGAARAEVQVLSESFLPLATIQGNSANTSGGYTLISLEHVLSNPGAAYVVFVIALTGTGTSFVDDASLDLTLAADTPTPEPSATATTEPSATPTPASPGGSTATPTSTTGGNPAPTDTHTPAISHTPTRTPTGTRTPTATATRTPARTAAPPRPGEPTAPLPTSTPTLPAGSASGGLLANGDFEVAAAGKPAYWQKLGGEMFAGGGAAGLGGCLESDTTSTKWLYQVVGVEGGSWYSGTAMARLQGGGNASIRVSWYGSEDGSGSQIAAPEGTVSSSQAWSPIAMGPVQAPPGARSARFRLTLQPTGSVTACFDDAVLRQVEAPPPEPDTPATTPGPTQAPQSGSTPTRTATARPGTALAPGAAGAGAAPAGPAGALTLRITEIMSDPVEPGRDAAFEWVELANVGSEPVDLQGWRLGDGTRAQTLPALVIGPGEFAVVAGGAVALGPAVPGIRPEGGEIGNGLGNSGDVVRLFAPDGSLVDEVSFGDDDSVFDPAPPAPGAGETLGLIDVAADAASENWAITLRPTPGEANLFPPKPVSTVAGAATAGPPAAREDDDRPSVTGGPPGGEDGSSAPWIVMGGLIGLSLGVAGLKLGPGLRALKERTRAR